MSRPTMSKDGRMRVTLRIPVRLDLAELTAALTLRRSAFGEELPRTLAEVRAETVESLRSRGDDFAMRFGDLLSDDEHDSVASMYRAAVPLVARAFGFGEQDQVEALRVVEE